MFETITIFKYGSLDQYLHHRFLLRLLDRLWPYSTMIISRSSMQISGKSAGVPWNGSQTAWSLQFLPSERPYRGADEI